MKTTSKLVVLQVPDFLMMNERMNLVFTGNDV